MFTSEEDHDDDILVDPTPVWKRKRYFIGILAFCGLFNIFALRNNLSVGIVEMTRIKEIVNADGSITYEQLFDWSSKQKGFVLSSYFGGFILTQILGGVISQRIGGHLPFGIAVGVSSILNLLTPIAANISIYALIGIRVVDGLFEVIKIDKLYGPINTVNCYLHLVGCHICKLIQCVLQVGAAKSEPDCPFTLSDD